MGLQLLLGIKLLGHKMTMVRRHEDYMRIPGYRLVIMWCRVERPDLASPFTLFSAIRRYGKDLAAIADVIGNKTVSQVSSFFVSYRRRFNLEEVLREWEAEQEVIQEHAGSPEDAKGLAEPGGEMSEGTEEDEVS